MKGLAEYGRAVVLFGRGEAGVPCLPPCVGLLQWHLLACSPGFVLSLCLLLYSVPPLLFSLSSLLPSFAFVASVALFSGTNATHPPPPTPFSLSGSIHSSAFCFLSFFGEAEVEDVVEEAAKGREGKDTSLRLKCRGVADCEVVAVAVVGGRSIIQFIQFNSLAQFVGCEDLVRC
ncbi:hypothetical protein BKA80DRAFT_278926 [Phyllosticta citrichinensis]